MRDRGLSGPDRFTALATSLRRLGRNPTTASPCWPVCPFTVVHRALPGLPADDAQARYIEIEADGITIIGIYLPNGNSGGEGASPTSWPGWTAWPNAPRRCWTPTPRCSSPATSTSARQTRTGPRRAVARRRAGAPGNPRSVPPAALGRPDRRGPRGASARGGLHLLGLPGRRLAARSRPADRPRAAVAHAGGTAGRRRARPAGTRRSRSRRTTSPWWSRQLHRPSLRHAKLQPQCAGAHM